MLLEFRKLAAHRVSWWSKVQSSSTYPFRTFISQAGRISVSPCVILPSSGDRHWPACNSTEDKRQKTETCPIGFSSLTHFYQLSSIASVQRPSTQRQNGRGDALKASQGFCGILNEMGCFCATLLLYQRMGSPAALYAA